MIKSVTCLVAVLQTLFCSDAEELAREMELVKRRKKLTGDVLAQTLVFGWLDNPEATLDDLADFATASGVDVSPSAIDQRITERTPAFLESLLCRALDYSCQASSQCLPLFERFNGVFAVDTSDVALPDCLADILPSLGGSSDEDGLAGCGLQVCLELSGQGIVGMELAPTRTNELAFELAHTTLPEGALRLADLGFFSLDLFASYDNEGVYYLSRWKPHLTLWDEQNRRVKLLDYLRGQKRELLDQPILVGKKRLAVRLVAVRLDEEAAERRKEQYRQRKQKKGKKVSAEMLEMCEWDVSLTNVPQEMLSWREVVTLRRLRWQIELLFKLFKSVGKLDQTKGRRPERVLTELWAKLLGQVVQGWTLLVGCGDVVRWSWYRAAKRLCGWWKFVVQRLAEPQALADWLRCRLDRLRRSTLRQARKKCPAAFQFLLHPYDPKFADGSLFPLP
jgi:hypothetical protein